MLSASLVFKGESCPLRSLREFRFEDKSDWGGLSGKKEKKKKRVTSNSRKEENLRIVLTAFRISLHLSNYKFLF